MSAIQYIGHVFSSIIDALADVPPPFSLIIPTIGAVVAALIIIKVVK